MKRILIAGATGYLGRYLVKSFKEQGFWIRVLVRDRGTLAQNGPFLAPAVSSMVDDVHVGDVTKPTSLTGACNGVDYVCSAIGLTRQAGEQTFYDVDYAGNLQLLREAERHNVAKFMYIHVCKGEIMNNPIVFYKQAFTKQLHHSTIPTPIIIKPTGYFSDMSDILKMAQSGRVYLLGSGSYKLNPIHGEDLADYCADAMNANTVSELEVGGPTVFKHREIASLAFKVLHKQPKIVYIPHVVIKPVFPVLKIINPTWYALASFFYEGMGMDVTAPPYGKEELKDYFHSLLDINNS